MEANCYFCGAILEFIEESDLESLTGESGFIAVLKCRECGAEVTYIMKEETDA